MTRRRGSVNPAGWLATAQEHRDAVHDVALLEENRTQLLQRLERVVVALALTLDAEAAAHERLARMEARADVPLVSNPPVAEWALLAQRYRDLLQVIGSINEELGTDLEDVSLT